MNRSESITNLSKAMAVFHSLVGRINKDAKNPFFKSNYASLSHILTEIQEPLEKAGLVISQFPDNSGLTTLLIHADTGEFLEATYIMPVAKVNDPQALGSAITYARRYAVSSILSLKIDDDDAETAMKPVRNSKPEDTREWLNKGEKLDKAINFLKGGGELETIETKYRLSNKIKESLNAIINQL